jgi:hypothetical protein
MKATCLTVVLLLIPALCLPYERSMLGLTVPSTLETGQMEFSLQHRFFGEVADDPLGTFFGMDLGANVQLMLRGPVWRRLEINAAYIRDYSEYLLGASYTWAVPRLYHDVRADVQFFTYRESELETRKEGLFYLLVLQTHPLAERFAPAVNLGYDGYNDRLGLGFGASFDILERLVVQAEYYPVAGRDADEVDFDSAVRPKNYYSFGFTVKTWGHHFVFLLSNGYIISTRRLMLGAESNDLYFGFNLQRLFHL